MGQVVEFELSRFSITILCFLVSIFLLVFAFQALWSVDATCGKDDASCKSNRSTTCIWAICLGVLAGGLSGSKIWFKLFGTQQAS